jgi:protein HIRA/HIR1
VGPSTANGADNGKKNAVNVSSGIIPFLERHTTTEFLLKGRAYTLQRLIKTLLSKDGYEDFENSVSIAHLENRIAGALALGARDEFRLYLFMYAKRLGAEGHKLKVEELLKSLVGDILVEKKKPGEQEDQGRHWFSKGDSLGGWERTELLKGVVMILGKSALEKRWIASHAN